MLSREVEKIIVPEEFYIRIDLIPIFVSSIYCTFLYHFLTNFQFFHGNNIFISKGTVLSSLFNIVFNYFLIKCYNIFGVGNINFKFSIIYFS